MTSLETQEKESCIPECSICFSTYDNVFKTPLLLPCSHTFCMECLSKLCVFKREHETFCCPMCRAAVTIPPGGVPKLPPDMLVVSQFPLWMGQLQEVWMEGSKLCWKKGSGEDNLVVTIYLLGVGTAAPHFSQTRNLVEIPRQPHYHRCSVLFRNYACIIWIFITYFTFLTGIMDAARANDSTSLSDWMTRGRGLRCF
uniref:RING-type domain-containing protein n=1 Tax=Leptobrachium leishanense TaxID=445787 RepID=A0A8C5R4S5_9ANUR